MNKDRKKKRKEQSIKEKTYPKINIYNPWGRIIGSIRQGESIDYQKLLLKKGRRFPQSRESPAGKLSSNLTSAEGYYIIL